MSQACWPEERKKSIRWTKVDMHRRRLSRNVEGRALSGGSTLLPGLLVGWLSVHREWLGVKRQVSWRSEYACTLAICTPKY